MAYHQSPASSGDTPPDVPKALSKMAPSARTKPLPYELWGRVRIQTITGDPQLPSPQGLTLLVLSPQVSTVK